MKKLAALVFVCFLYGSSFAQTIENIYFNLYTDSLKKGFYNYINVDGKFSDGSWQPLDTSTIFFTSNAGFFKGNDLFIDSSYTGDTVVVIAALKSNPFLRKEAIIHIRKRGFDEPLKISLEMIAEPKRPRRKTGFYL